jgi:glycosyltransferase involved in cell wall biosynthesis
MDGIILEQKILTLAIPTYNRGAFLEKSLSAIQPQLETLSNQIEFIVSDNCSTDNTQDIVHGFVERGMPITYIRHEQNLGPWVNITGCYKMARTKYVWVLGDDDYLTENILSFIINILTNDSKQYGLLFHSPLFVNQAGFTEYTDKRKFFLEVDQSICWISGSILNTKHVKAFDSDTYKETWKKHWDTSALLDVSAVRCADYNIILHERIFASVGADAKTSGGYDFMDLAVGLILLSRKIADEFNMPRSYTKNFKIKLFKQYISVYIELLLFQNGESEYILGTTWSSLFKYYWGSPYLYTFLIYCYIKHKTKLYRIIRKVKKLLFH